MRLSAVAGLALILSVQHASAKSSLSDAQIKQQIIKASIGAYSGNCTCLFNTAVSAIPRCGRGQLPG